jgi:predicted Fe-Mo cluster-binding NifX family protein
MKVAITCQAETKNDASLNSTLDSRFGRAAGFIVYDLGSGNTEFIDNTQNLESPQGAGIQAAKAIINAGAKVLITGNVGPKAFSALEAAQVEIYTNARGTVGEAIESYRQGLLKKASGANVEGHW